MHGEIGGYLELERFSGPLLHEKALALSSGRACLAWLIGQRPVRKLLLPDLLCDVVEETCARYGVETRRYAVGPDLRPSAEPRPGEYVCIWKGGVNLRADHSLEALPLAVIRWGEAVTVTELCEEDETGEPVLWGKILYRDYAGWSMLKYFTPVQNTEQEDD